jgi:diketogulonate reductase-like aldo/keto reductase
VKRRPFGATGFSVPVIGQGTSPAPDVASLRHGISLGMTHIDTAEMYQDGYAEQIVGEAIRGVPRDTLFLVSKVLPENGGRRDIVRSCESTLKRMGIDELDCYLLHWRGDVDLAETMQGLEMLLESGKTRSIGVSNLDPWDLREATAALEYAHISCNQVLYNLAERTIEDHELPWAHQHQQALVAYAPLGGIASDGPGMDVLGDIAAEHKVTPECVALAFLLRDESVFVIPKANQGDHLEANAKAGNLELSYEDVRRIEAAYPKVQRVGPLPTI